MSKVKSKAVSVPVPQSDDDAREAIRQIGDTNREILRLQADMNDQIARLQETFGNQVAPLQAKSDELQEGLKIYCEANRSRLTGGGKVKFHQFATGQVSWRSQPAKVTIRGKDAVIEAIKSARLGKRFLRIKEEINKEAMLEDRATAGAIKGVSIGSEGEVFAVEPHETDLVENPR